MTDAMTQDQDTFKVLFDMAADCLLILDMSGRIVDINANGLAQRGYARDEVVGRRISEFDPPEYAARVPERMGTLFREGRACFESAHICKDGSVLPVEINCRVIDLNGERLVFSVVRDITERKRQRDELERLHQDALRARQLLEDEQRVLASILDNAPTGMHLYELQEGERLVFIGANPAADRILGVDNRQFVGKTLEEAFPALSQTEVPAQYKRIAGMGGEWSTQQIDYNEGRIHGAYEVRAYQIAPGRMAASFDDITERKQTEAALQDSEERWKFALEGAGDGVWDWQVQTGVALFSKRWKAMLGYAEDEFDNRADAWVEHLHPDDRARVMGAVQAYFSGETPLYSQQFRMRCKGGEWKWILARGMVTHRDADGKPVRMIGTHSDISGQKQIEQALRNSKQALEAKSALLQSVLDNAPLGIWYLDDSGRLQFVNKTFCNAVGISEQDFLAAHHYSELLSDRVAQNCVRTDQECLQQAGPLVTTEWFPLADGQDHLMEFTKVRLNNASGETIGLIGLAQDITQREEQAEALRLASLVYQNTSEAMAITDAENRIIAINPAFTATTGYTADEVVGQNPRLLNSGRQDASFYRSMWQSLNSTGSWQGEIWNRRKSGEVYAEQLSINTIAHADGSVYRRIALFQDVTERKRSEEIIWRQANFDLLTGLPNRRMFRDRLSMEVKKAHRNSRMLALLFIDLDRFKEVNDTLGHHVGDELLVQAAGRLTSCVRETDTVARLGGDEFTVILSQLHGTEDVEHLAQDIIAKLAEPYYLGGQEAHISASIGITVYPTDSTQIEQLLQNADQAMYLAKAQGRNCFSFFTPSLHEAAMLRLRMLNELKGALETHQLRLYFQPIVELATGNIYKAEALLRWQHPQHGLVSPMAFIPLAEETGLIVPIGDWALRESARHAKRWGRYTASGNFQISVNKSPVQFRSKDCPPESWIAYLRELDLPGCCIAIEITEGLLLNRDDDTARKLLQFREAGLQISIDDFGTGYSSLSYLKKFDIDYLKIDRSFVHNMVNDHADQALCEAIVVMAHKLGLKVIAEGVETEAQRDLLLQMGCDFAQGYLFAKPLPGEEFEAMLHGQQFIKPHKLPGTA